MLWKENESLGQSLELQRTAIFFIFFPRIKEHLKQEKLIFHNKFFPSNITFIASSGATLPTGMKRFYFSASPKKNLGCPNNPTCKSFIKSQENAWHLFLCPVRFNFCDISFLHPPIQISFFSIRNNIKYKVYNLF